MSLIESNDKGSTFDDVNWAWLLPLLLFLPTLEPPKRREITINAQAGGKSVNITYDPHDAEAVKAAEAWRKALFSAARWTYEEPIAVRPGDNVTFTGQRRRDYQPTLDALKKASEPLRDYLKAHGNPHTSVIVTQYGVTKTQDEPAAPEPEPDKLDYDPLHDTLIDPLPFEYLCYWEQIAQEYSKVREAWDNGKRARIPRHITSFLSILSKRLSKDQEEAMKAMLRKPDATAPKVDLQELDRAIRDLSGVVKDDQSGLRTYFDGVNMTYILECLKKYREMAGGRDCVH